MIEANPSLLFINATTEKASNKELWQTAANVVQDSAKIRYEILIGVPFINLDLEEFVQAIRVRAKNDKQR